MDKVVDLSKPVQTRGGRKARIICTDRSYVGIDGDAWPILALVETASRNNKEEIYAYCFEGDRLRSVFSNKSLDLINVPEKTERYYRLYTSKGRTKHISHHPHATENEARKGAGGGGALIYTGILKITYENGVPVSSEIIPW